MSETYQKLAESIAIYKPNKNTRVWWIRARIDKKEIRKSTKQRDKDQAIKTAWAMFSNFEERKNKGLLLVSSNTINSLNYYFTDYLITETGTISPDTLKMFLDDVDVLLIPSQNINNINTMKTNLFTKTMKKTFFWSMAFSAINIVLFISSGLPSAYAGECVMDPIA